MIRRLISNNDSPLFEFCSQEDPCIEYVNWLCPNFAELKWQQRNWVGFNQSLCDYLTDNFHFKYAFSLLFNVTQNRLFGNSNERINELYYSRLLRPLQLLDMKIWLEIMNSIEDKVASDDLLFPADTEIRLNRESNVLEFHLLYPIPPIESQVPAPFIRKKLRTENTIENPLIYSLRLVPKHPDSKLGQLVTKIQEDKNQVLQSFLQSA